MTMAFNRCSIVLNVWLLWGFNLAFGNPIHLGSGLWGSFLGHPSSVAGAGTEEAQASIPLVSGIGAMPDFRFPQAALVSFQFVFAAITPLLFLGSIW
jgi:Amt family ammonium transporter